MTNPAEPVPSEYGLVMPFTVCQSRGGPYEDQAFTAGFQAGQIYAALAALAVAGGTATVFTVRTPLVPQVELIAMRYGFTDIKVRAWDDYPEEWSFVSLVAGTPLDSAEPAP